jgi:hypothetical protein
MAIMTSSKSPSLKILINSWTLRNQTGENGQPWQLDQSLSAVKKAGFDAYSCPARSPGLKESLERHGLRFGAAFDAGTRDEIALRIREGLAIDDGPMNCQLANHDTPVEEAIRLTIALMEESERQGAEVHLEMHRDTCTETPEKTYAIAEGVKKATGVYPRINFDFSHPGSFKHLNATNYIDRLFENVPLFQQSTLWHMRPFNGHHCQVPVTDGRGNLSPEYEEMRPFIRQGLRHWLAGPRPRNELWVCPELGPKPGYGLSCFPDSWQDAIVLGDDIRRIWNELRGEGIENRAAR